MCDVSHQLSRQSGCQGQLQPPPPDEAAPSREVPAITKEDALTLDDDPDKSDTYGNMRRPSKVCAAMASR